MAIREIREEGDEILRKKSRDIETIDEKIKILAEDMVETLHKYNGVGLAGPQVGILKKIIVIDIYDGYEPFVLINPVLTKAEGEREIEEGCLSFPNKFAKIIRHEKVTVKALDINGKKVKITAKELLAQALEHEIDHLNGELFVDKMIPGTLETVTPEE